MLQAPSVIESYTHAKTPFRKFLNSHGHTLTKMLGSRCLINIIYVSKAGRHKVSKESKMLWLKL